MKQIPLLQGKVLLIEMPKEAKLIGRMDDKNWSYHSESSGWGKFPLEGNWRIIGMLSGVTEPEASKLVKYTGLGGYVDSYENYQNEGYLFLPTALESLESSILAEGYGFDSEPEPNYSDCEQYENPIRTYEGRLREWNSRQSRVLDHSRCLLLGRIDG